MLQSRDYPTPAVVVAALDLDEVHAALARMPQVGARPRQFR
jgi:hypothetical protein